MRKRLFSMLLVLLMMLALCACGGKKNELLGRWAGEVDMAPILVDQVDSELDLSGEGIEVSSFGDYLGELPLRVSMELREDGTYVQAVDEASIAEMQEKVVSSTVDFYRDIFRAAVAYGLKEAGIDVDVSSDEALEEVLGMSIDEAMKASMGADMEGYVRDLLDGAWDDLTDDLKQEGKYKVKDGKLYLSAGVDYEVDEKIYHPYTLKDGVLTVEKSVGANEDDSVANVLYPIIFRAVR